MLIDIHCNIYENRILYIKTQYLILKLLQSKRELQERSLFIEIGKKILSGELYVEKL